jgi:hypothetical protein
MLLYVTARPNMLYIVYFEPYCSHGFVLGDASPLLSLTPKNAYNMLATSTTNKALALALDARFQCGISQSFHLKTSSTLIPNVTAWPNLLYIFHFGPYRPHGFIPGGASSLLSLTPQNMFDKLQPALLIRPATTPSPADVGFYNLPLEGARRPRRHNRTTSEVGPTCCILSILGLIALTVLFLVTQAHF